MLHFTAYNFLFEEIFFREIFVGVFLFYAFLGMFFSRFSEGNIYS
ncbi:hypothetical protein LEP1GSC043_1264 [Leptospira weilii str. Ecochallenge]|uniref:Uncharacterized protein n=1 Tax=Leptospira weilii str. Ecochallenge TaxID=1049986 RepID=N1U1T3_9LEPT|nr:hypothetical protein LEP1GSC043_1264 [Leptospira weilii str. Ecochallenge]